jgi:hypothetical protein
VVSEAKCLESLEVELGLFWLVLAIQAGRLVVTYTEMELMKEG